MPSGTIWPEFLPKLARFAPVAPPGDPAPRDRQGVARGDRSCEVRSRILAWRRPGRRGQPRATLASFGKKSGQMVPDGIIMVPDGINALY